MILECSTPVFQENSRDKNQTYAYICFFTRRGTSCRTDMPFAMCSSHWRTLPCLDSTTENYTVLWLKIAMQYCIASIGNQLQCWASTTQSLGRLAGISHIACLFVSNIVSASSFAFAPSPLKANLLSMLHHLQIFTNGSLLLRVSWMSW